MQIQLFVALATVLLTGMAGAPETKMIPFSADEVSAILTEEEPSFSWDKSRHDFGKIAQGKPVNIVFNFTNTGAKPLLISSVKSPCGCTVTEYSKEAIAPGKTGFVKLIYNAANKGFFTKTVTVVANTSPENTSLNITGEVVDEVSTKD